MRQSKKAIAIATLIIIASSPATADDTRGFYSGAGAGYMPAGELNLQPVSNAEESLAAFAGFRLNSQFGLEGFYADVVVFDPAIVTDHATFPDPHKYATGVEQVLVNGVRVIQDGEHNGATPGRVVRGPGWDGWAE